MSNVLHRQVEHTGEWSAFAMPWLKLLPVRGCTPWSESLGIQEIVFDRELSTTKFKVSIIIIDD